MGIGRELAAATIVAPAVSIPADKIEPDEKYNLLEDRTIRGIMGSLFSVIGGTQSAEVNFGGPVYLDTIGHTLLNLFGDYSTVGSTPANATTFTAPLAVGATGGTLTSPQGTRQTPSSRSAPALPLRLSSSPPWSARLPPGPTTRSGSLTPAPRRRQP